MAKDSRTVENRSSRITVIGAGTMGAGIAQVCLQAGFSVKLQDVKPELVEKAQAQIARFIRRQVEKGQLENDKAEAALGRLTVTTDLTEAAHDADWVIEAIYENIEAKLALYQKLNALCRPETIFASNTSGLSITQLGAGSGRPEKFVGLHFFNPVPLMELVELIAGAATDPAIIEQTRNLAETLGKTVVTCQDAPNFIVNRLNRPVSLEAQLLVQEGVTAQAIDKAMELGASFRLGPLKTADLSGLDIGLAVTENIFRETGDPRYRPTLLQKQLVRAGHLGKKTGQGFYGYPAGATEPVPLVLDIVLPEVAPPAAIAIWGEGAEATWWRGKLGQNRLPVTDDFAVADMLIVPNESGLDFRDMYAQAVAQVNEKAVIVAMHPLVPLNELAYQSGRPAQVVGLHCPLPFVHDKFFEVTLALDTTPASAALVKAMLDAMRYHYTVSPATPAGIVQRIICAFVNEAAFALQEKLADPADLDKAMRLGMNYLLGPLEYADRLGLDIVLATLEYLQTETGDPRYRPAQILRQYVRAGRLR